MLRLVIIVLVLVQRADGGTGQEQRSWEADIVLVVGAVVLVVAVVVVVAILVVLAALDVCWEQTSGAGETAWLGVKQPTLASWA